MKEPQAVPEPLRRAVADDARPVRPLRSPWARALVVALWALAVLIVVPAALWMRPDAKVLGFMLSWGVSVLETVAGLLLIWLALREAIPGRGVTLGTGVASLTAAGLVMVATAALTWARSPLTGTIGDVASHGADCFSMESALGLPALLLTLWLVVRAFPVRPVWAGLLGGAGAGMLADGVQHLLCGIPDLHHVLVWHGGAALGLAAVGGLLGWAWRGWQSRSPGR